MDWSWFDALPNNLQQLLLGAAAEYAGLAGPALYAADVEEAPLFHRDLLKDSPIDAARSGVASPSKTRRCSAETC